MKEFPLVLILGTIKTSISFFAGVLIMEKAGPPSKGLWITL
jgi:hypothetical protein